MPFSFALYNFDAYLLLSYITDKLFLSYYVEATFLLSSFNLKKLIYEILFQGTRGTWILFANPVN